MNIKNTLLVLAGLDPMEDPAASSIEPPSVTQPVQDDGGIPPAMGTDDVTNEEDNTGKFWLVMPPSTEQPTGGSEPPREMGVMGAEPSPPVATEPANPVEGQPISSPHTGITLVTMPELIKMLREVPPDQDDKVQLFPFDKKEEADAAAAQLGLSPSEEQQPDQGDGVTDTMKFMNKPKNLTIGTTPSEPGFGQPGSTESVNLDEKIIPANDVKIDQLDVTNPDHEDGAVRDHLLGGDAPKVKIPSEVKAAVKKSITRATEDLKDAQDRATIDNRAGNLRPQQPADVDFYVDLLNAYQKIDELLGDGTEESIKRLQLFVTSLANWLKKEFPLELMRFVATGGKPLSVKDHFASIKAFKSKGM